jgi:multidrug efflux pump subunit AcrB
MWIVKIALTRPYTFIVLALSILLLSPVVILRTPTDIFPSINIPVIAAVWKYGGLDAEQMENRITSVYERLLTTTVNDIEHVESTSLNSTAVVKIFLQPTADVNAGVAQVSAVSQSVLRQMPPGTSTPFIISYNASSVPIIQLALSSKTLSEQAINDLGQNLLRPQLVSVPGAAIPYAYGGKQRQIMVDVNPQLLQAKGLSPVDVVNAVDAQNLILPAGSSKIGQFEYDVDLNGSTNKVAELNDMPIKVVNGSPIFIRDVANVRDGYTPQTNIVRQNGQRASLLTILKAGNASTLDVVAGVRQMLAVVAPQLPPDLDVVPLADQSVFVRAAVSGVIREAIIAACLTGLMILLFLGSWRSTLIIAVSIPLSILTSVIVLSMLGETINIMTLGGLALAVGILVDDATVTIENIERNFEEGKDLHTGILDGAAQIAVPALVSTLCICIVFLPMFFLTGVSRYLFVPLAEAVVFAMLASYVLSRTLVPTLAMYLLKAHKQDGHGHAAPAPTRNPFVVMQRGFERQFERARVGYRDFLSRLIAARRVFVPIFLLICVAMFGLLPWLGQDFFPSTDTGQFKLHVRAKTGTRIEETARLCDLIDAAIRREIPSHELRSIIDNIGLPYSGINLTYSNSAPVGTADADILVSLEDGHVPTDDYVQRLRVSLARDFPGTTFYFLPADIVSQILNFGAPAAIDVQVDGANLQENRQVANKLLGQITQVPGATDVRIQQVFDQPKLHVTVDRTKAATSGFTQRDVASSMLVSLSGSFQTEPSFWLDPRSGISYNLVTQTPQYSVASFEDLQNIPISGAGQRQPAILGDLATITRGAGIGIVSRYQMHRVIDIYGGTQGRDLGAVGADVSKIVADASKDLPRGTRLIVRGQLDTMHSSFNGLLAGLAFAIVLVYLLIVVNFQSWLDPFIIITALPAALAGIVVFLFLTHTTLSVPALMGAIMCMGVGTANSILVVSFAKEELERHGDAMEAALAAGFTRFRPVLMTAAAMIIGMIPMALGLGEGGEQNAPLGRAVIGGLTCATIATLLFVPVVFSILHGRRRAPRPEDPSRTAGTPAVA